MGKRSGEMAMGMKGKAWKGFAERYRPMMEKCLAEECHCADGAEIVAETLGVMAGLLPNYRYQKDEKGAMECYLRKMLRNRTVDKGKKWTTCKARGRVEVTDALLAEAREFLALRKSVIELAVQELENSTKNEEHLEIFCRVGLLNEKPAEVAKSLGAGLAKVYQVKKRMGDRLKGIAFPLFREVGLVEG